MGRKGMPVKPHAGPAWSPRDTEAKDSAYRSRARQVYSLGTKRMTPGPDDKDVRHLMGTRANTTEEKGQGQLVSPWWLLPSARRPCSFSLCCSKEALVSPTLRRRRRPGPQTVEAPDAFWSSPLLATHSGKSL